MSNCQMHYTEILLVHTTYSEVLRVAAAVQNKEVRDGFRALSHLRRRQQAPLPEGERMGFSLRPHRTNQKDFFPTSFHTTTTATNLIEKPHWISYFTFDWNLSGKHQFVISRGFVS